MSSKNIVHRDLKPFNILFKVPINSDTLCYQSRTLDTPQTTSEKSDNISSMKTRIEKLSKKVKLIDFGLATYLHDNEIYTKCGTPGFLAPELFGNSEDVKHNTTSLVDIFSIGSMFYFMLTNKFPFDCEDNSDVYEKNRRMEIDFNHPRLQGADPMALDLLKAMLEPVMNERISCEQALKHEFFNLLNSKIISSGELSSKHLEETSKNNIQKDNIPSINLDNLENQDELCNIEDGNADEGGLLAGHMLAKSRLSDNQTVKSHLTRSIQSIMVTNSPFHRSRKRKEFSKVLKSS